MIKTMTNNILESASLLDINLPMVAFDTRIYYKFSRCFISQKITICLDFFYCGIQVQHKFTKKLFNFDVIRQHYSYTLN